MQTERRDIHIQNAKDPTTHMQAKSIQTNPANELVFLSVLVHRLESISPERSEFIQRWSVECIPIQTVIWPHREEDHVLQ